MSELPRGWAASRIGELCVLVNGRAFKPTDWGVAGLPIIRIQNLNRPDAPFNHFDRPVQEKFLVKNGDLLFAWSGTPGTSFGAHIWNGPDAILNQHIFNVRYDGRAVDKAFFRYAINQTLDEQIAKAHGGVGLGHVTKGRFEETAIALPPLSEQRRIVARIDSLSAKSRRARDHLDHIPRLVEKYKQAILAAAHDGNLPNVSRPRRSLPLRAMVATLDQGWSPKCESEPAFEPDDWAVIKTTAILPIHFIDAENKRLPSHLKPRPEITIEPNDVLITRAGPRSRVAIACVVKQTRARLMLCDKAYRLRMKSGVADPTFLAYILNAPQSLDLLERMKTGISDSGLNLTQSKFLDLLIPEFTLIEQSEIVRRIEVTFAWIDRLAAEATSARTLIAHLDQAVLAKAFRGELVPQSPTDEPATALLERCRLGRAAAKTQHKQGRRG